MSVNKAIILGNLTRDPDVKFGQNGNAITNASIATNSKWKDKQSGEMREDVQYHNIIFFNRLAEIAGEYLKKGSQVYIEGRLQTRKYTDKNGVERYMTEIVASELQMLGGRGDNNQQQSNQQNKEQYQDNAPDFDEFKDDIPF